VTPSGKSEQTTTESTLPLKSEGSVLPIRRMTPTSTPKEEAEVLTLPLPLTHHRTELLRIRLHLHLLDTLRPQHMIQF